MGGASSYLAILAICGFLSAAWMATKVSKVAGISSIVAEIATGVILGPRVLGMIHKEYAVCETDLHTQCVPGPDFIKHLDRGESIGPDLGHFVYGEYCPRSDYKNQRVIPKVVASVHVDDEGEEVYRVTDDSPYHNGNSYGGDYEDDGHMEDHLEDHSEEAGHLEDHMDESEEDAGHEVATPATADSSDSSGHHRRLSGGGGKYTSYEQCIQKSCEAEVAHECGLAPDVFTLIGHAGVAMMIFESGMHFDFEKARVVGPKACLVAVVGTIFPVVSGSLLMTAFGKPLVPDAISVGTALAPTSVGIALRLLGEAGVLQLDFGQAIITAAFVDDILSLVLFNVLFSLRGDFDMMATVVNPIIGVLFMGVAMVLAVKFWPRAINEYILPRLPVKPGQPKVSAEDEALFLLMMGLLIVYATITHFLGTHLWGCFIAGMSFACVDGPKQKGHTHHVWVRQTKRVTSWMIRIFFACTVAFSIPVNKLFSFDAFWKGTLMGIGPCVMSKVFCALFMGKARFVIGWAMVGRAEFAYLIAQMAASANMIDADTFSIALWALLYATVLAPIVFRTVLTRYIAAEGMEGLEDPNYAKSELEEEEEEDNFLDDRFEQAEYPSQKPVADGDASIYGKALTDLDKLSEQDMQKDGFMVSTEDMMEDAADQEQKQQTLRRGFWYGRRPAQKVDSSNGFLCCLFFRNIVVN